MGHVYLADAEDAGGTTRTVVVKVLPPEMAGQEEFRSMFLHEARLGSLLRHPGIASIYDYGEIDDVLYLAMAYVDGMPLSRLWQRARGLPLGVALGVVADLASALGAAHSAVDPMGAPLSIVHRDVTPQNVLVSRGGRVKLIDFGVAKSAEQDHQTRTGILKGKLAYMAPEQFRGVVTSQTDIFALGVILHELVSGRRLFKRQTDAEVFSAILADPIPALHAPPDVARVLQPIVDRAIAREPGLRFSDAQQLEQSLRDAMKVLGVESSPAELARLVDNALAVGGPLSVPPANDGPASSPSSPSSPSAHSMSTSSSPSGLRLRPSSLLPGGELAPLPRAPIVPRDVVPSVPDTIPPPYDYERAEESIPPPRRRHPGWWLVGAALIAAGGIAAAAAYVSRTERATSASARDALDEISSAPSAPVAPTPAPTVAAPAPLAPATVTATDVHVATPATPVGETRRPHQRSSSSRRSDVSTPAASESGASEPSRSQNGQLFLDTDPWSTVRVDGRSLGPTPIVGAAIPAGSHSVELRDASGSVRRIRLNIAAGRPTKRFVALH